MTLFDSRITATGEIDRLPVEHDKVRIAMTKLDDDLQQTKYDLYSKRVNETTFMDEFYNEGTRRFEPYPIRAFSYRVGIGMYTPESTLHLQDIRDVTSGLTIDVASSTAADRAQVNLRRARGFHTSREAVQADDVAGEVRFSAYEASGFQVVGIIRVTVPDVSGDPATSGEMRFLTAPPGGTVGLYMGITSWGSVFIGNRTSQLSTAAVNGFLYIPSCNGTPTGVPTTITGVVPLVYDTNKGILYIYSGGAWRVH